MTSCMVPAQTSPQKHRHLKARQGHTDFHIIGPTFWETRHHSRVEIKEVLATAFGIWNKCPPWSHQRAEDYIQTCSDSNTVIQWGFLHVGGGLADEPDVRNLVRKKMLTPRHFQKLQP